MCISLMSTSKHVSPIKLHVAFWCFGDNLFLVRFANHLKQSNEWPRELSLCCPESECTQVLVLGMNGDSYLSSRRVLTLTLSVTTHGTGVHCGYNKPHAAHVHIYQGRRQDNECEKSLHDVLANLSPLLLRDCSQHPQSQKRKEGGGGCSRTWREVASNKQAGERENQGLAHSQAARSNNSQGPPS